MGWFLIAPFILFAVFLYGALVFRLGFWLHEELGEGALGFAAYMTVVLSGLFVAPAALWSALT